MPTWFRNLVTPPVFEGDEEKTRRAALLNIILWATLGIFTVLSPPIVLFGETGDMVIVSAVILGTLLLMVAGLIVLMRQGRVWLSSVLLCAILLVGVTVGLLVFGGIRTTIVVGYLVGIFIAGLLLGGRGVLAFGIAGTLCGVGVFYVYYLEIIPTTRAYVDYDDLFMLFAFTGLMAVLVILALRSLTEALEDARQSGRALAVTVEDLEASSRELNTRTLELERRSAQLQAAAEVVRGISEAQDLEDLVKSGAALIQSCFALYHVAVFVVDERRKNLILRSAAGQSAQSMLESGYRVQIGVMNIIGSVASSGRARINLDVGENAVRFEDPLFPDTRSEIALPLRVSGQVIGVVDMQSWEGEAFDAEDVPVLQTMVDQLAVAIENMRLLREMQQTVRELEVASGQYTQESWRSVVRGTGRPLGYRYRMMGVEPVAEQAPETREAWVQGRSVINKIELETEGDKQKALSALAMPMKLRDQVMGVLNLRFEGETISPETISMIEEVADRLALALENARLLEESQRRASRERLVREITDRMRSVTQVEEIVQAAVDELFAALGPSRTFVQLRTDSLLSEDGDGEA